MTTSTLKVTIEFNATEISDILRGVNELHLQDGENPITAEEVMNNPEMQQYLIAELKNTKDEIVEGSYDAIANDWLMDIVDYRN